VPIAFEVLASHLLATALEHLQSWLPNGRRQGREWCVGSLGGEAGQSLKINIDTGRWQDFATGEKGGDLTSLYAALRGLSQADAAKELGSDADSPQHYPRPEERAPEPTPEFERPPSDAPYGNGAFRHAELGAANTVYVYKDVAGVPLCVVARFEGPQGKTFFPFTWHEGRWKRKAPPKPRPLYHLEQLAQRPQGAVVIVEGEKCADALAGVTVAPPVLSFMGGAPGAKHADWAPLIGRQVVLWPDADPPGIKAMQEVASQLMGKKAPRGTGRQGLARAGAGVRAGGCRGRRYRGRWAASGMAQRASP
jgi:hypothetical protein